MIFRVFYYYYFVFYKNILKETEPHLTTTLALSASIGLAINAPLNLFLAYFYCYNLSAKIMFSIVLGIILITYLAIHRNGNNVRIIQEKPSFFGNKRLSKAITIVFFIVTTSLLFVGPLLSKEILDNHCK
jgi:hypothetical protein